ncbi:putative glycosyl transferase [Planktothrix agardhii CCAP 1459/11A]|uniref:Putative glycosyl transferase n=1 Tax=Planktothrix agardhii CCAP 1459/11A TaxID=282420 RepID=A0A479ZPS9_PLAAG|nr:glycosyltransferase [Planktothrix agardhii]GCL34679.1 putative glycosyl transferase [Planktothrix agardhii CCAP 1459/11A]
MRESDILRSLEPISTHPPVPSQESPPDMITLPHTTVLVITGMHRSGTSLIAAILREAGVHLGDQLIGADTGNIRGHFEDVDFVQFHQTVLRSQNLDIDGWMIQPNKHILPEYVTVAKTLIARKSQRFLWGWKDPRTTLFLNFWQTLIPQAKFIFVYRSPWEVVDSLYRRGTDELIQNQPQIAVETWIEYNQKILEFYRQNSSNCVLLNLNKFIKNPEKLIIKINQKFNLKLSHPNYHKIIKPNLLNHEVSHGYRIEIIKQYFPKALDIYLALSAQSSPLNAEPQLSWSQWQPSDPPQTWICQDWLKIRNLEREIEHLKTELKPDATQPILSEIIPIKPALNPENNQSLSPVSPQILQPYQAWLKVNQWNEQTRTFLQSRLKENIPKLPKLSVIMPVYNSPVEYLEKAIASVTDQIYVNWELCIADDGSTDAEIQKILNQLQTKDPRIRVIFRPENGNISQASNSAASQATGEFLLFLDHDDQLTLDALAEIALYLGEHPETDFLYSDDDKIDSQGNRFAPQFKPDWSPELLLSYMYIGHLWGVKREIFEQLGGFRIGFEGAQDYDFALRATEICKYIAHLPLILYHWRAIPGSIATSAIAKPNSFKASIQALQAAFERRGIAANIQQPNWAIHKQVGVFEHQFPDQGPSVTILIPSKNQKQLLAACLSSLKKTTYQNYQIVIIDNGSDDPDTLAYLEQIPQQVLKIETPDKTFNFAAIHNQAVLQIQSDYILFLNNDTEVISPHWLSQMIGYAQIKGVGAVGAKLVFPNQKIQHAGVVHGLHQGLAGHAFKLRLSQVNGYLSYIQVVRNYSAVSAACLLTPRNLFLDLGGFDSEQFAVAYNDVDYCYRLSEKGWRSVYCPTAELIHHEGATRGYEDSPQEVAAFRRLYGNKVDPYYSPHLSLADENFRIQPRRFFLGSIKKRLRVLMGSHLLDLTGAPLHQYEIAVKLAKAGIIEPIVFSFQEGPLQTEYQKQGIQVIICQPHPLAKNYDPATYHLVMQKLSQQLSKLKIDVFYINTLPNFFLVDCAQRLGIPCIWNIHESEPIETYLQGLEEEITRHALECFRFPYRVVFVSYETQKNYLPLNYSDNFTVIYNGINRTQLQTIKPTWTREKARESLKIKADEIVLLLLGTVGSRKGQKDLPLAFAKLPPEWQKKVRILIVGDRPSPYSDELKTLVRSLPIVLQEKINIVPETRDTERYYRAADIFILTSRIESFPRVILEAMNYGLPIIATPVFGVKEQVKPGVNGLFYPAGNIDALAKVITQLLTDEKLRSHLAQNSSNVLERFNNFEQMVESYRQILQEAYLSGSQLSDSPQTKILPQFKGSGSELPLVSICIPTYNGEKYLTEALLSAVNQTYPNLEIIISDDSSTDKTLEIIDSFQKKSLVKLLVFQHEQYGLAKNWNYCISQAQGKYIKFLFQDDLLESNCLEQFVNLAETDAEIGLVFSPRNIILSPEAISNKILLKAYYGYQDLHQAWSNLKPIQMGKDLLADPQLLQNPLNKIGEPSTVLLKKATVEQLGGFDSEFKQLLDLDLWLRIMSCYKIGFVNQKLSSFRLHPDQQTFKNAQAGYSELGKFYQKLYTHPDYSFLSDDLKNVIGRVYKGDL